MKPVVLLIAVCMVGLGLTGVFWPEGVRQLVTYFLSEKGLYVGAGLRMAIGLLLFLGARATRTPKTVRVIATLIFLAGFGPFFTGLAGAEAFRNWLLGHGPDVIRIIACLPLTVGLFIAGSTLAKGKQH